MSATPKTMKAVVIHGIEDYRMEERPVPVPKPGEVLVKVEAVGICAGDSKCFAGAARFWADGEFVQPPVTPGHEFSGTVVALGEGAGDRHGVSLGDLVVSEQIVPCHECRYCQRGGYQMCIPHNIYGFKQASQGAMADFMIYPAGSIVHKIPKGVDPFHACFVEPLACSLHAVELGQIKGNVVVVSGCGPLGIGAVAAAVQKNPRKVVALDVLDWKLEIAQKCGTNVIALNPAKVDLKKEIDALTDGFGCDVYIELTGNPQSVRQGLDCIARHGRFVEYAVFGKEVTADWSIISDCKELTIVGGHLGPRQWPKAIEMVANKELPIEDIITHKFPLSKFLEGIKMVTESTESIKVMLIP